jgi:hypothetical protein
MVSTQARAARCRLNDTTMFLSFFPDTGVVLIADALGRKVRETYWPDTWEGLLAAFDSSLPSRTERLGVPTHCIGAFG